MNSNIKTIDQFFFKGKRVFLRLDLNVPINKKSEIQNDNRIKEALPTIEYLLDQGSYLVIASHLGRPEGKEVHHLSMESVGVRLQEYLQREVVLVKEVDSDLPRGYFSGLRAKTPPVLLLENLRFDSREQEGSIPLAKKWASYTDIYINDAFGTCHRKDTSMYFLPKAIHKSGIGFLIQKELQSLGKLKTPSAPFVMLLGGSKVKDKINLLEKMINVADVFLIGGAMSYTFLHAQGYNVGKNFVDKGSLRWVTGFLERAEVRGKKIVLPCDHLLYPSGKLTQRPDIQEGLAYDIGDKTIQLFCSFIKDAKTIFWNGPMGFFEKEAYQKGTLEIAKAIAQNTEAFSVVGGGDSVSAIYSLGVEEGFSHISTGGGASLEFLTGELCALEILDTVDPVYL